MEKQKSKNQDLLYINREISWLSFNARVLQEAADPSVPLLERLKFLGIFSSNLDEFFRVRVGTLKRMIDAGIKAKSLISHKPKKVLNDIHDIVLEQREQFDKIFRDLTKALEQERIFMISERELNDEQKEFVQNYFDTTVRPALVPIMLNSVRKFPYLINQILYHAVHLKNEREPEKSQYALIEIPAEELPRFIVLPRYGNNNYVIMLDDIIRFGLKDMFAIFDVDEVSAYTIKLTRDAELDIDDDVTSSLFEKISKSIERREWGQPVRFVYDREMPEDLLNFILENTGLTEFDNLIPGGRYHNARHFIGFPKVGGSHLRNNEPAPIPHPMLPRRSSLIQAISEKDVLLHYPYHSFNHLVDFLREAAIDPKVTSIKMTIYRLARDSKVINALINAVRNGKKVTVLMELQARFDEGANIKWTKKLEAEGAHLISGISGMKIHAKLCLVTRIEDKKKVYYASIGTGNFNESTAKIYSDHALLTSHKHLTKEVAKVFEFLENTYKSHRYKYLLLAPFYMRKRFKKLIRNEIKNAEAGKDAYILAKMNSLVDREMINLLYQASQAGVNVKMIIRGICSLVPGVDGLSENIEVISIVDKYLEHSRIFIFCNEGDEKIYISSADWMVRNLSKRIEIATPIYDPAIKEELKQFIEIQFKDANKARIIDASMDNQIRRNDDPTKRSQIDIYNYLIKRKSRLTES
ncbi:MAG: polyphosphate kinase 1 [Calditrichaeota bacterium]|nr:MAG: polyphosphate kinase 1 [Calditrichota bacterium]